MKLKKYIYWNKNVSLSGNGWGLDAGWGGKVQKFNLAPKPKESTNAEPTTIAILAFKPLLGAVFCSFTNKKIKMKDNKLEIGDKLYCIQYGGIQKITIVDRLTPKTAFCGTSKFNLELENGKAKLIGGGTYSQKYYILETEDLKSKHKKNMLVKILSSTNFDKFSLEDLENVINILKVNI